MVDARLHDGSRVNVIVEPLALALGPPQPPVVREERQGLATIWAGERIDLTMRLRSDRPEASDAQNGDTPTG